MAGDARKLSITYSSGLIPPPEYMSTLAVFYDEIWLPNPYELDLEKSEDLGEEYTFFTQLLAEQGEEHKETFKLAQEEFYRLKTRWSLLFKESLLQTLSLVTIVDLENTYIPKKVVREYYNYESLWSIVLNMMINMSAFDNKYLNYEEKKNAAYGKMIFDLASPVFIFVQNARNDKPSPELFISDPSDTTTSRLAGFLVDAIFQMKIPQLKTLNAEQILEVRYKLRDFKEGFTDYVVRLTNDVEALLRSGETSELIAARKVAERHFETEYNQIRRQIEPLKIISVGSVLAASGAFFLAGAVQTTPALLAALVVLYGTVLKDFWQQEAANQAADKQAFKYIAKLESAVSKRLP